jgi:osmoprotectant transport system ATP-binding protein
VFVEGKSTRDWDPIHLQAIGYVICRWVFPHFTISCNVGLVPSLSGWDATRIKARVNELLEMVD